jgi:hypothetical protein
MVVVLPLFSGLKIGRAFEEGCGELRDVGIGRLALEVQFGPRKLEELFWRTKRCVETWASRS